MNELQEPRLTNKPDWLELPEEEKLEHIYWYCKGYFTGEDPLWSTLYHSKEEAETKASIPRKNWVWNREEASSTTLQEHMSKARRKGRKGIKIKGYRNGEWVILKEYPAEIPLL